jgi:hypothetical protein
MAPGDTVADYDSLTYALTHAGVATMLLDMRGSGWSVSPSCPLPDTWNGREELLEKRAAVDTRDALAALGQEVPVDSSRYLVVGVGATAPIAVQAAVLDRRITALLLVSPKPAAVERGPMRAQLARLKLPVFYQMGPEDFEDAALVDAFYRAGNRQASRVAEAHVIGHGIGQFHHDPAVAARVIRWLNENLPARAALPRARRQGRRSG